MSDYAENVMRVEELVARATDEALPGPEWALNMALCDCANAHHTVCDDIVRLLQRRLQSGEPKVTLLTLILTETIVKNGPRAIHSQVGSTLFLNEVAALSDGSLGIDVQKQALLLIHQWADAFQGSELHAFEAIYRQLKMQGVVFPEVENDVPIFTPPSSTATASAATGQDETYPAAVSERRTRTKQLEKLQNDLKLVQQKIKLMRDLDACGQSSEQMEDVLDFLRQCQPRMNTLIEGGVMGKIDELTLEQCLNVNDNLMKTLEECNKTKNKDIMTFNSPPSTSHMTQEIAELDLDEGGRTLDSVTVAPRSVIMSPTRSTPIDMDNCVV